MKRWLIYLAKGFWQGHLSAMIFLAMVIFSLSVIAGYYSEALRSREVFEELGRFLKPLKELQSWELAVLIFVNNAFKSLVTIFSGLVLGLGPLFFLVGNGLILGIVTKEAGTHHGIGIIILSLLPHGSLEFPAILMAAALGFRLGMSLLQKSTGNPISLRKEIKQAMAIFLLVILPALLAAALVESFITPLLI